MSRPFINWKVTESTKWKTRLHDAREEMGDDWELLADYLGRDMFHTEDQYWLTVYEESKGDLRMAILWGFEGGIPKEITENVVEDSAQFLGFSYFRWEKRMEGFNAWIFQEYP